MVVREDYRTVRLLSGEREQSLWRKDQPNYLAHSYAQLMALSALTWRGFIPQTKARVLIVGLGGGILCRWFLNHFAHAKVEVVEPDAEVLRIAREVFELDRSVKVWSTDGRTFFEKATQKYDIIVLDAFDETYIPSDMLSAEFLNLVKRCLRKDALLIANGWVSKDFNPYENRTYQEVFENLWELKRAPNIDGNRILLYNAAIPLYAQSQKDFLSFIQERAHLLDERLERPTETPIPGQRKMLSYLEMTHRLKTTPLVERTECVVLHDGIAERLRSRANFDYVAS